MNGEDKMNRKVKGLKVFFILISIFILTISLNSCNQNTSEYQKVFDEIELPSLLMKGDKLLIPLEKNNYLITWSVDKPDYIDVDGNVIKNESYDVEVKVTIFINGVKVGLKTVNISQNMDLYFESIEYYVRSSIKPRVNTNVRLRYDYYGSDEVTITYQSSRPDLINHDGTFIKHEYDEEVELSVNVVARGNTHFFTIKIIAIGIPDDKKIQKVDEWLKSYLATTPLTDEMELPITHPEYGGTIRWLCEDPFVVLNNKDLYLPIKAGKYILMAEIIFHTAIEQRQYDIQLEAGFDSSDLNRAIRFIKASIPNDFENTLVLYEGRQASIVKHIIDTTTVEHKLHYGNKPIVLPSELNRRMYDGYQMPNSENVLWIVVHETGSRTLGNFASVFDRLQQNRAYNEGKLDANASWHYTVDDHEIIQNYSDYIACWHAGDNDSIGGGNMNGIGIEMCINPDGKYDIAMRNNARLIAYLMHQYNLNLLNIKKHRDFMVKECPETMIKERLWFIFLDLIAKEYISQSLLKQFNISYEIETVSGVEQWTLDDIYYLTEKFTELKTVNINVTVNDYQFNVTSLIKP